MGLLRPTGAYYQAYITLSFAYRGIRHSMFRHNSSNPCNQGKSLERSELQPKYAQYKRINRLKQATAVTQQASCPTGMTVCRQRADARRCLLRTAPMHYMCSAGVRWCMTTRCAHEWQAREKVAGHGDYIWAWCSECSGAGFWINGAVRGCMQTGLYKSIPSMRKRVGMQTLAAVIVDA